ncbi:hypothetical protein OC725_02780, partial ['Bituminaria bituminosa' little leaf phytoplasma]
MARVINSQFLLTLAPQKFTHHLTNHLNHSIPDTFGIVFQYNKNIIFYTGDFKIDHTPEGPLADYAK